MATKQQEPPFRKVRADHATETAEDYLEAVWELAGEGGSCRVTHLARHMGVSHVTVVKIISRLQSQGLVDTEPYRPITLTALGRRLAESCRRRHAIVEAFLLELGVPPEAARRDGEGIEHHVSQVTLDRMATFLRDRGVDPGAAT